MRCPFILSGVVCLSFMLLPACAPQTEEQAEPEVAPEPVFDQAAEEAAIRQATEERLAAWNAKRREGLAGLCRQGLQKGL